MRTAPSLDTPIAKALGNCMTLEREITQLVNDAGVGHVAVSLQEGLTHLRACTALLIRAESERLNR